MDQVDQFIIGEMEKHHIPGLSVGLLQRDKLLFTKCYGYANTELSVPTSQNTVFAIASITKLFTATAVMMLAEAGLVAIDEPISRYLTTLPPAWSDITIRQILAHQSGIRSYTAVDAYWKSTRLDISKEEILKLVSDHPLDFQPGEKHAYDNTGYYLLGLLIEMVSGMSYGDYLATQIFEPLEMTATRVNDPYQIVEGRAAGYTHQSGVVKNTEYYSPSGTFSAGVLLSTVEDLAKWSQTLYTNQLLSAESRKSMWTPHRSKIENEDTFNFVMGLGWFLVNTQGDQFAGHNGSMVGFSSSFSHFFESKLTVIMLCNMDQINMPHEIAHGVVARYFDRLGLLQRRRPGGLGGSSPHRSFPSGTS
ncbi:MAG: serine hydrolase domain-containing protein [Chloroflexota bacterium]